jgi:hypothetical protein
MAPEGSRTCVDEPVLTPSLPVVKVCVCSPGGRRFSSERRKNRRNQRRAGRNRGSASAEGCGPTTVRPREGSFGRFVLTRPIRPLAAEHLPLAVAPARPTVRAWNASLPDTRRPDRALNEHAREAGIEIRLETRVNRVDAHDSGWRAETDGEPCEYGLPVPEEGVFSRFRRLGVVPSIVDREVIETIKAGQIEVLPGVESLDAGGVRLADGTRIEPETVIAATGYRRRLESLVGHLGVLDERGVPRAQGARAAAPGLRFIGYTSRPGALGYMSKQAKEAAKTIARELRSR